MFIREKISRAGALNKASKTKPNALEVRNKNQRKCSNFNQEAEN